MKQKLLVILVGKRKEYKIMIDKIYLSDTEDNKSFVIRIADEELLNKTRRNNKRAFTEVQLFKMENLLELLQMF